MGKYICIALITAIISLQLGVVAVEFTDVPVTASYYEAVDKLSDKGIVQGKGNGTFGPFDRTTRAEFCAFVARANNYNEEDYANVVMPFKDIEKGNWAEGYISYCYKNGYVNGVSDTSFSPDENVTYEQAIKIVVCVLGIGNDELLAVGPQWYSGYIEAAEKINLLDGIGYSIGKPAPRSFVAQIIYNSILVRSGKNIGGTGTADEGVLWEDGLIYERPENISSQEEDAEQRLRIELGINDAAEESEEDKPRYDESSERNIGR